MLLVLQDVRNRSREAALIFQICTPANFQINLAP